MIKNVSRYLKISKIDEGNYGVTYKAKDVQSEKIVAIKKIKLISKKNDNNILGQTKKKLEKTGHKINKALNKVKGVLKVKSNPYYAKLEEIRAKYGLSVFSDEEILRALEETNGNVDEALAKLFH